MHEPWTASERLTVLWTAVFGLDGSNGLRGQSREQARRIKEVEDWKAEVEALVRLVKWLALAVVSMAGFLTSDKAAAVLRAVLAAL